MIHKPTYLKMCRVLAKFFFVFVFVFFFLRKIILILFNVMIYFLRPEKVAEAFMHLVEEEDSNGKILTIMTHNGIQEHKYVVGKSML